MAAFVLSNRLRNSNIQLELMASLRITVLLFALIAISTLICGCGIHWFLCEKQGEFIILAQSNAC
jgi:hypothetical protein